MLYYFIYCINVFTLLIVHTDFLDPALTVTSVRLTQYSYSDSFSPKKNHFILKKSDTHLIVTIVKLTLCQTGVGQSQPPPPLKALPVPSNFEKDLPPRSSSCWWSPIPFPLSTDATWSPPSWISQQRLGNHSARRPLQLRCYHRLTCSGPSVALHQSWKLSDGLRDWHFW